MGWDVEFSEPILLPKDKKLTTLRDAAIFITKLPKAEHDAEPWQAAMEVLLPSQNICPIGMMGALNHSKPKPANTPRRKRAKAYRIVR
jgi:hypothetical protein